MAQSVLGSLALGYRPLWGRDRRLAGVQLFAHDDTEGIDGSHLLRTIAELWSAESPLLVLSPGTPRLLKDVLHHAGPGAPLIEVPLAWWDDAALAHAARLARGRGAALLASGTPLQHGQRQQAGETFARCAFVLSAHDAAKALHTARSVRGTPGGGPVPGSPIGADSLVVGVASRALAAHALDRQGAWAVAGWPSEDVRHRYRGQPLPPARRAITQIMRTLDAEPSFERIESMFAHEPALAYRLLVYLNSAGLGLRSSISSLRHGFMMLGYRTLGSWLAEQLAHASEDHDLQPVNASIVLRARLAAQLMESGLEDDLRREVYLCGLFSQLALILDEAPSVSLARIPLPDRLVDAVLRAAGPYAPALEIAAALDGETPRPTPDALASAELSLEAVNRALLRMLATASA